MSLKHSTLHYKYYLFLLISLGILFLLFHPKLSASLIRLNSENRFEKLQRELISGKVVTGQQFWEFREFYSPGHYIFNGNGVPKNEYQADFLFLSNGFENPILYFSSLSLTSIDILTPHKSIKDIKKSYYLMRFTTVYEDIDTLIVEQDTRRYVILLFSNEELKKTNGFLDYTDKKTMTTSNLNWLSITAIRLN